MQLDQVHSCRINSTGARFFQLQEELLLELGDAFGRVLRQCRRDAGLTQEALVLEAELERNYISLLELGQRQPSLATVFRLAAAL
ncbi:helix-turn-helix domain-containing protein [Aquabacterium sp. A7-Y]|uniref:helix-turn-helix domain-containing protein n=1 Tax=Aquabacterium sp. A7-Y TaxID=1349605 RepID=UPI00223C9CED|nr:helix-turn-helix transcriptional regulator [Aquabacterium sp. A7-Y]MCW7541278.1 helix-turn-helix domain-containing protein [Aquabacterium sp. A7-Y]